MDNKTVLCMNDHYEMVKSGAVQERRLKVATNEQKNATWEKYYKEPQYCIKPRLGEETRECLNRNITARNAFEAEWKARHGDQ